MDADLFVTGTNNIAIGINSLIATGVNDLNPFLFIVLGEIDKTKSDVRATNLCSYYAILDCYYNKIYHIATLKPAVGILNKIISNVYQRYYHNIPWFNSDVLFDRAFEQYHFYIPRYITLFLSVKEILGDQCYDIMKYLSQYYVPTIKL